jgi:putative oxidoreductase
MTTMERFAAIYARIALGTAFLSAVAARFGLWRDRGPHPFAQFIQYTAEVNSFLPASLRRCSRWLQRLRRQRSASC